MSNSQTFQVTDSQYTDFDDGDLYYKGWGEIHATFNSPFNTASDLRSIYIYSNNTIVITTSHTMKYLFEAQTEIYITVGGTTYNFINFTSVSKDDTEDIVLYFSHLSKF